MLQHNFFYIDGWMDGWIEVHVALPFPGSLPLLYLPAHPVQRLKSVMQPERVKALSFHLDAHMLSVIYLFWMHESWHTPLHFITLVSWHLSLQRFTKSQDCTRVQNILFKTCTDIRQHHMHSPNQPSNIRLYYFTQMFRLIGERAVKVA